MTGAFIGQVTTVVWSGFEVDVAAVLLVGDRMVFAAAAAVADVVGVLAAELVAIATRYWGVQRGGEALEAMLSFLAVDSEESSLPSRRGDKGEVVMLLLCGLSKHSDDDADSVSSSATARRRPEGDTANTEGSCPAQQLSSFPPSSSRCGIAMSFMRRLLY